MGKKIAWPCLFAHRLGIARQALMPAMPSPPVRKKIALRPAGAAGLSAKTLGKKAWICAFRLLWKRLAPKRLVC
jgi:hypothetical protein